MKTKERIKTLLLTVLFVGAVILTYSIWFYDVSVSQSFSWSDDGGYNELQSVIIDENTAAVIPFAISYRKGNERFGAAYHYGSVNSLYEKISPTLRYILSNASAASVCNLSEWNASLAKDGILIDYEGNVPITSIAKSVGAEREGKFSQSTRYALITADELYFKNSKTGECYKAKHGLNRQDILSLVEAMSAAKCSLALDAGNTKVAPETLLFNEKISTFTLNGYNSLENFDEMQMVALLKVFNMNYNTCGKHIEQDGTRVYIEELNILKIMPDGYIEYTSEIKDGDDLSGLLVSDAGSTLTQLELGDAANGIIAQLLQFAGGDGKMYMRDTEKNGNVCKMSYGWSFGGVPVDRQDTGTCADVVIEGSRITHIGFYMRRYESGGSIVYSVPQKIAIASIKGGNKLDFSLRYTDGGSSGIEAQWYTKIK